ncbi:MAG: Tad domain-containing protein, partial [Planctomycetales bacterium]|nr:Tad domain-containing protein [Planctomycetales bacterium]
MTHLCSTSVVTRRSSRRGSVLVLLAFLLPVAVLLSAFAINYAYMDLCRTEMVVATDAATRAAGRELALTGDMDAAVLAARNAAQRNTIAGEAPTLEDEDFVFGRS